jgi:Skp family chaperone for outer membrane proteins
VTRTIIAVAVGALCVAGVASAQTTQTQTLPKLPAAAAPAPELKVPVMFPAGARIAYFDFQRTVQESKAGRLWLDRLKALAAKLDADLALKNNEIATLTNRAQAQSAVLSPDAAALLAKEIDRRQREAQFAKEDRDVQVGQLQQDLVADLEKKVMPIIEALRVEKDLWIVFSVGDNSNVVAANPGLDLSEEVIKRLDAKG